MSQAPPLVHVFDLSVLVGVPKEIGETGIFPVITALGFDPIWFGVVLVVTVELGLISPPVGLIVFVIKSVVDDISFATIFKGVAPFIVTDLIRLVILIAFPILATWLPSRFG